LKHIVKSRYFGSLELHGKKAQLHTAAAGAGAGCDAGGGGGSRGRRWAAEVTREASPATNVSGGREGGYCATATLKAFFSKDFQFSVIKKTLKRLLIISSTILKIKNL
jgi:hypothetical protein